MCWWANLVPIYPVSTGSFPVGCTHTVLIGVQIPQWRWQVCWLRAFPSSVYFPGQGNNPEIHTNEYPFQLSMCCGGSDSMISTTSFVHVIHPCSYVNSFSHNIVVLKMRLSTSGDLGFATHDQLLNKMGLEMAPSRQNNTVSQNNSVSYSSLMNFNIVTTTIPIKTECITRCLTLKTNEVHYILQLAYCACCSTYIHTYMYVFGLVCNKETCIVRRLPWGLVYMPGKFTPRM